MRAYRIAVLAFSLAFVAIGLTLLVRTAAEGGGVVGFLVGALFVAFGAGRLTLERRRSRWSS
jgi:hypothetical protein